MIALTLLSGCATIVKDHTQSILLTGGQKDSSTKVSTPTGSFTLTDGSTTVMLPRSKDDIPIEVTCNGTTKKTVIPTEFDVLLGGFGNIIFGGIIGILVDSSGSQAYDAKTPFDVSELCATPKIEPAQQAKN